MRIFNENIRIAPLAGANEDSFATVATNGDVEQGPLVSSKANIENGIIDVIRALVAPPGSPATGDRYFVAGSGSGAWAGHGQELAEWDGSAWTFRTFPFGGAGNRLVLFRALYDDYSGAYSSHIFNQATTDNELALYLPGTVARADSLSHAVEFNTANVNGRLVIANQQVVGRRKIDWYAPTGTATRSTFATSTVTLEQLAERMKALIDDLAAHGLIGESW